MRTLVPIDALPPMYQNDIIRHARVREYRRGRYVFKQGDRDNSCFYLVDGELEMSSDGQAVRKVVGGSDTARYALAQLQPRQLSAKAKTGVTILEVDRTMLNKMLAKGGRRSTDGEVEVSEIEAEEPVDWMTRMLQSELFARIPAGNIQRIFALMEPVEVKAGNIIIRQGDPGDYYYVIQEGRAEVTRMTSTGGKEIKLGELREGDSFGEEALVADAARNATVTMLTAGELMRLTKHDFVELIKQPILRSVTYAEAQRLVMDGAVWLDVRFPDEHKDSGIQGSLNMPLHVLQAGKLEEDKSDKNRYIVFCDTGDRSSLGAFLLTQRGFDACYLAGGLTETPYRDKIKIQHKPARPSLDTAPETPQAPREEKKPVPIPPFKRNEQQQPTTKQPEEPKRDILDADIRVSALKAELANASLQLEEAMSLKSEAEAAKHMAERTAADLLRTERKKLETEAARTTQALKEAQRLKLEIEAAKRKAEADVEKARAEEAEKLRRIKEQAERRLHEEKAKLEATYARNVEELAKIQGVREEFERKHLDQLAIEQRLREEIKINLSEERRKLEATFARHAEELEQAQREKEAAEAARRAAAEEAETIIAEYKAALEKRRAEEELKRQAKREREAAEARRIQDALDKARRAKVEAEAAWRAAEEQAARLQGERASANPTRRRAAEKRLRAKIHARQAEASEASKQLEAAQRIQKQAETARRASEEQLIRQRKYQEQLRKQLEKEVEDWRMEYEKMEAKQFPPEILERQRAHMQRIKEKAEAARKRAELAVKTLLRDITMQLRSR
ncbi:MAG: cyclic nucleotide-binding domain-containing protein [Gammaproteobacteria bacterium]|nr:cyclic nucleotide-binding domain-containing protein [Gammaproteobacteria bacterium]